MADQLRDRSSSGVVVLGAQRRREGDAARGGHEGPRRTATTPATSSSRSRRSSAAEAAAGRTSRRPAARTRRVSTRRSRRVYELVGAGTLTSVGRAGTAPTELHFDDRRALPRARSGSTTSTCSIVERQLGVPHRRRRRDARRSSGDAVERELAAPRADAALRAPRAAAIRSTRRDVDYALRILSARPQRATCATSSSTPSSSPRTSA